MLQYYKPIEITETKYVSDNQEIYSRLLMEAFLHFLFVKSGAGRSFDDKNRGIRQ